MDSWLGIGLEVTLDDSDRERIEHDRMTPDRRDSVSWGRLGQQPSPPESAPLMIFGNLRGGTLRAVIHPAPIASALWGSLGAGHGLAIFHDGQQVGTAKVSWVADLGRGLKEGELHAMVTWSGGGARPFRVEGQE